MMTTMPSGSGSAMPCVRPEGVDARPTTSTSSGRKLLTHKLATDPQCTSNHRRRGCLSELGRQPEILQILFQAEEHTHPREFRCNDPFSASARASISISCTQASSLELAPHAAEA